MHANSVRECSWWNSQAAQDCLPKTRTFIVDSGDVQSYTQATVGSPAFRAAAQFRPLSPAAPCPIQLFMNRGVWK